MHLEDINVGDFIVVLSWNPVVIQSPTGETMSARSQSLVGCPLEILAIDAPFLAVAFHGQPPMVTSVDTRIVSIRKASPEYVRALHPYGVPKVYGVNA